MSVGDLEFLADKLTRTCDPGGLGFETTTEVELLEGAIGQERAISALKLA